MSRFFDALREASRSRPPAKGTPGEADWGSLDANGSGAELPDLPPPSERLVMPAELPPRMERPERVEAPERSVPIAMEAPAEALFRELQAEAMPEAVPEAIPYQEPAPANGPVHGPVNGFASSFGSSAHFAVDEKARIIPHAADTVVVEHYRRLRTKLLQQHATKPFQSLVIASPGPQEGKTVTVLNLGLSFALLPSFRVLVVDGDLRRGSLGKWLGVEKVPGLSNLIEGTARLEDAVLKCEGFSVNFMVRGTSKLPPGELLNSSDLSSHFRRMAEHFDLVLVDSPPVNLVTDTQLIAGACDAVLLVARAYRTTRKALEKAAADLTPFRVVGTVLNGGTRAQLYRRYNGYY